MELIESIAGMRQARRQLPEPVGFVPTMGYLHEGHLSLVRHARQNNPSVVVSIFVNPSQFGPGEDFGSYPRDLQRDLELLEREGTDIAFYPPAEEMYPRDFGTWVDVEKVTERLEGASRPGHFRGVTTIVAKLLNLVEPAKAYFGQKDAQQAVVIRKMAADLNMDLEVVTLPTVRESDGLAMSSRNTYLSPGERKAATVLYRALGLARQLYEKGEKDAEVLRRRMTSLIQEEPRAAIDYVSVADSATLEELDTVCPPALVSMAVKIGRTRLIDNTVLE